MEYKELTCYIPKSVYKDTHRKRQKPKDRNWTNVYWYRYGYRHNLEKQNVIQVYAGHSFNKNTLYKCAEISRNDAIFDYYKILKEDIQEDNILLPKFNYRIKPKFGTEVYRDPPLVLHFD